MHFTRFLFFLVLLVCGGTLCAQQSESKLVQFSGVVMTSDSLQAIPYANIWNTRNGIGVISNYQGFFSLVAGEGDTVRFSSVGFKDKTYIIPRGMTDDRYSIIQLMTRDTIHLAATMIYPWPDPEDFRDAFLALDVPDTYLDKARKNLEREKLREMGAALAPDGNETTDFFFRQEAKKYYYAGQTPPIQLFNVFAWKEFIEAWKRGDFKRDR